MTMTAYRIPKSAASCQPTPLLFASIISAVSIGTLTLSGAEKWTKQTQLHDVATTSMCDRTQKPSTGEKQNPTTSFRIESHLMDKIQQKKYLTSSSAKDGIPSTLRILAIDLPSLHKVGFTGHCRLSHDRIFPDEVAGVKEVPFTMETETNDSNQSSRKKDDTKSNYRGRNTTDSNNKNGVSKLRIPQKVLVKQLVQCSSPQSQQQVGVELLDASIADLNRYKLRKTHKFGSYSYDPGKYYDDNNSPMSNDDDDDEMDGTEIDRYEDEHTMLENEIAAPWNQSAWKEELSLRINGQVQFDSAMEPASAFQRMVWGKNYKTTVPVVRSVWDHFLPSFAATNPNGLDGNHRKNVRARNKPHAVIANGAALQLVPGSLRQLQRLCKLSDVPLFVVNDQRKWGGNTHASVEEALKDLRSEVKNRVITQALKQQGSFMRGRLLGQAETEAKWQIQDRTKRAKELLGIDSKRRRSERNQDWSSYDAGHLEKKLVERKVIQHTQKASSENDDNALTVDKQYSTGMIELARKCVEDLDGKEVNAKGAVSQPDNDNNNDMSTSNEHAKI